GNVTAAPSASANGRYLVYTDTAANLSNTDANGNPALQAMDSISASNIFLFDRQSGKTTLVSHAASSVSLTAHGTSKNAAVSADGNWVAYVSNSDNLVGGELLGNDIYNLTVQGFTGGTFTLSYGGQTTAPIAYSFDGPTELANIQA